MEENQYNLGIRQNVGEAYSAGIAFIVIPSDVDRDKYINECFATSTVSIYSEHNGWSNRVPIDIHSLNFINFPIEVNKFGTAVSFILEPIHKRPIIMGIFNKNDELSDLVEHQFKLKRKLDDSFVEIAGSPKGKYLGMNVVNASGGLAFINVRSKDETGELNVEVSGNINVTATADTTIKQYNRLTVKTIDRENENNYTLFEQTNDETSFQDSQHNINTDKLIINGGDEPFILGNKLKTFLDDFITEISNITVTTALGQMPILNKAQVLLYKKKTQELLSEIAFIDK